LLFTLILCVGCGDGYIGRECGRTTPDCGVEMESSLTEHFRADFPPHSSHSSGTFRIVWQLDNPCVNGCEREGRLFPAAQDAVWSLPRQPSPDKLELIDHAQTRTSRALELPIAPNGLLAGVTTYITAQAGGAILARMQWDVTSSSGVRAPGPDEVQLLQPNGSFARTRLNAGAEFRLPLGTLSTPSGFLLFAGPGQPTDARLFDSTQGSQIWRTTDIPRDADRAGGAAVAVGNQFVLSASSLRESSPSVGLLWLGADGAPVRYSLPQPSEWRDVRLLPVDEDEFVVAARSDLITPLSYSGYGNLDIVRFRDSQPHVGVRLMRACYHELGIKGFARDPEGNLFVSTVGGEYGEPRSLLCRLPVTGEPRCYEPPSPDVLLGEIVASARSLLFAISGDQILRIELPD
jgi:hypothetical protein